MAEDPDALIDLVRTSNELQAVSLIAELESHGIAARAFNVGLMQYQMPMLQGQRVMVRRSDLPRAREVLNAFEPLKGEDVDWDSVDTGDESPVRAEEEDRPRFVCARCGYSRDGLPAGSVCPECSAPAAQRHELMPEEERGGVAGYFLWVIVIVLILLVVLGFIL